MSWRTHSEFLKEVRVEARRSRGLRAKELRDSTIVVIVMT